MKLVIFFLMLCLLPQSLLAQETRYSKGKVWESKDVNTGVRLRADVPSVGQFEYSLAPELCFLPGGTTFDVQDERALGNGEIWLKVNKINPLPEKCKEKNITEGWLAAKFRGGWSVDLTTKELDASSISLKLNPGNIKPVVQNPASLIPHLQGFQQFSSLVSERVVLGSGQDIVTAVIFAKTLEISGTVLIAPALREVTIVAQQFIVRGQARIGWRQPTLALPDPLPGYGSPGQNGAGGGADGAQGGPGAPGTAGSHGTPGPKLVLILGRIQSDPGAKLLIDLRGSPGGDGGHGQAGGRGGDGAQGSPASQSAFDCRRGPGNGGKGGDGGQGGQGGAAGNGGRGGELLLALQASHTALEVEVDISGGPAGRPGVGGAGGAPGNGGPAGEKSLPYCQPRPDRRGAPGSSGTPGRFGATGVVGDAGAVTTISLQEDQVTGLFPRQ